MQIIDAIPLLPIPKNQPQILSYFWPEAVKPGSLVLINVRNRKEKAVVLESEPLAKRKIALRKGGEFQLKKLDKFLSEPVISENQIKLALWLSDYYYAPLGLCIKLFLPRLRQGYGGQAKINRAINLIIVPEISWIQVIKQKLTKGQVPYSILHSSLTKKELSKEFEKIFSGEIDTIISTRVGLFLPYSNLKNITVYDEGDEVYFSDMTPKYNAVVVAQKLAQIHGAKITFISEYPAIPDPYQPADKYQMLKSEILNSKSETNHKIPNTKIVNLIDEIKFGNFGVISDYLREKISRGISENKKILLFVGRRGYANVVICKKCGSSFKCPNCDVSMVSHKQPSDKRQETSDKFKDILICHHCEHYQEIPKFCPVCGGYQIKGIGVGIQKVESEITRLRQGFGGQGKILKLDSDSVKTNTQAQKIIEQFKGGAILLSTQMVFPFRNQIQPDIVGIIDSDTLINIPDYKAQNKLFRQLYLLKNIANEEFIIQTRAPQNNVIIKSAEGDFKNFNLEELENRKLFDYPPYGRLVKLTFRHQNKNTAFKESTIVAEKLRQAAKSEILNPTAIPQRLTPAEPSTSKSETNSNVQILKFQIIGPSPAYIPKVAKNWIFNIIIKIATREIKKRNELLRYVPPGWQVEVDPAQII